MSTKSKWLLMDTAWFVVSIINYSLPFGLTDLVIWAALFYRFSINPYRTLEE